MGRPQLKPGALRWVSEGVKQGLKPALGFVLLKCFIPGVLVWSPSVSDRQLGANIGALWVKKCLVDTPSEFWGFSR